MKDYNLCEHCEEYCDLDTRECATCGQPLVLDSRGAISVWRLGDIEDGIVGPVLAGIREVFGRRMVLQPSFVRAELSDRSEEGWKGNSAGIFLNQVDARHQVRRGTFLSLGLAEENIVPGAGYNFAFGYGCVGAAVFSLAPLRHDEPERNLLVERAVKVAVHELGHGLGLDHHAYEDEVECVMVGDENVDDLDALDDGTADFCGACLKKIARRL